jgi:hypothetical protein
MHVSSRSPRTPAFIKKSGVGRALVGFVAVYAIAFVLGLVGVRIPGDGLAVLAIALIAAALAYVGRI